MLETIDSTTGHQILVSYAQDTLWINSGTNGACLARVSQFGIDLHHNQDDDKKTECLYCTHGQVSHAEWATFLAKMKQHYQVTIPNDILPGLALT